MISLIACMTKERIIGNKNRMPWHLPADLQHFKKHTIQKPVIMGRKTFESIGRPLPNRKNIILTSHHDYDQENIIVERTIENIIEKYQDYPELMFIGGGQVYQQVLPYANRLYLTIIDAIIQGDTYFPEYNKTEWRVIEKSYYNKDEKNQYNLKFMILEKN